MSTYSYKLTISYQGASFEGWQVQPEPHRTIQGHLNSALRKISKSEDIVTLGSGRTDSGVHALAQVVHARIPIHINEDALKKALNSHLPKTIRIIESVLCEKKFHPIRDAVSKRYDYLLYEGEEVPPFLHGMVTQVKGSCDWSRVESALEEFLGEHDFINFSTKGTEVTTTIRTIFEVKLSTSLPEGHYFKHERGLRVISVKGSGFLKQMVRLIVGTALAAGYGKISNNDIVEYLKEKKVDKLAAVAPADGLYLAKVDY